MAGSRITEVFFIIFILITFFFGFVFYIKNGLQKHHNSDLLNKNHSYKNINEIINDFGFAFEEHKITTEDGYILTAWRIPGKLNNHYKNKNRKKPVILNHGLLDSGYSFFALGEHHSLPFILANNG